MSWGEAALTGAMYVGAWEAGKPIGRAIGRRLRLPWRRRKGLRFPNGVPRVPMPTDVLAGSGRG
ncbi:hypothetical protein DS6A_54 [Mycobacterium phage DS6A]|uniref:Uncharacterized protein n=1 Tax=Mycobacterium phage DS6A TaxID=45764 RepID=G8I4G4_9CAUD|nr:hypothetical protein DS6A_54 [Mycobacterium phage DS6A]AER47608.1 hypothetical protein DS6A_54 [Mycobacterium phage DS6A]